MIDVQEALRVKDNFAKYRDVPSILIKDSNIDFKPRVSVCIPTYKRTATLKDTIDSVLKQENFTEYDIILSDNNPERGDDTERLMASIDDPRIKYYKSSSNLGMYGNVNRLIELADAPLYACIHDDDLLLPDFLSTLVTFLDRHEDIDFAFCRWLNWFDGNTLPTRKKRIRKPLYHYVGLWDQFRENKCPCSGFVARTEALRQLGGYDYDSYPINDWYLGVKAVINNRRVACVERELFIYRWLCNASLKKGVALGSLEKDIALRTWMASHKWYIRCVQYPARLFLQKKEVDYIRRTFPDFREEDLKGLNIKAGYSYLERLQAWLFRKTIYYNLDKLRVRLVSHAI